jgi:hypothetical protein
MYFLKADRCNVNLFTPEQLKSDLVQFIIIGNISGKCTAAVNKMAH